MAAVIRPARPPDANGIADVHVASWRTTYPGMIPGDYLVSLSARAWRERWRRVLSDPRAAAGTYVAVDAPFGVIGFGSCGRQRSGLAGFGGEFFALYLYDHSQGRGVGRRLMAAMAEDLIGRGITSAVVWVLAGNPSRWFYERLGGTRLAEKPTEFAGAPVVEIAYGWRDLAPLARLSADPSVR
ncbi:MAG TPA: GNAT family N-acetyltransferase [Arenibaculum sp.]|nr:GNAT family N-acetyltransferase [Arenibaculum sp.]